MNPSERREAIQKDPAKRAEAQAQKYWEKHKDHILSTQPAELLQELMSTGVEGRTKNYTESGIGWNPRVAERYGRTIVDMGHVFPDHVDHFGKLALQIGLKHAIELGSEKPLNDRIYEVPYIRFENPELLPQKPEVAKAEGIKSIDTLIFNFHQMEWLKANVGNSLPA